jgi:hypothetical protein
MCCLRAVDAKCLGVGELARLTCISSVDSQLIMQIQSLVEAKPGCQWMLSPHLQPCSLYDSFKHVKNDRLV